MKWVHYCLQCSQYYVMLPYNRLQLMRSCLYLIHASLYFSLQQKCQALSFLLDDYSNACHKSQVTAFGYFLGMLPINLKPIPLPKKVWKRKYCVGTFHLVYNSVWPNFVLSLAYLFVLSMHPLIWSTEEEHDFLGLCFFCYLNKYIDDYKDGNGKWSK